MRLIFCLVTRIRAALAAAIAFAAAAAATGAPIGVEPVSPEIIAGFARSSLDADSIYIWDGNAELLLLVEVTDPTTGKPLPRVKVVAERDRRVRRGPAGHAYQPIPGGGTDRRGHVTLRGKFPAAGHATGTSVFVLDSNIAVSAPGYLPVRKRISPIYRLDYPRNRKHLEVRLRVALRAR